MLDAGRTAKIYYYDQQSSTLTLAFLLARQPSLFGTFDDFVSDCKKDRLPDYCFLELSSPCSSAGAAAKAHTRSPT